MKTENAQYKILLIEDSGSDAFAIKRVLKKHLPHPCFIIQAENITDGEKILQDVPGVDLILLDLYLPDTNGRTESINRLKQISKEIPVVVLTGMKDYSFAIEAVNDGAQECVDKALITQKPEILCDVVEFTICRYRKNRQGGNDTLPAVEQAG